MIETTTVKRSLSGYILDRLTDAEYLAELQEAGDLIIKLELDDDILPAILAVAWWAAWEKLKRAGRVDDFTENEYYKSVLADLRDQQVQADTATRM